MYYLYRIIGNYKKIMSDTPRNAFNGIDYKGYNVLFLDMARNSHSYKTHEWATFLDWKNHGYNVNKGSKGVSCRTFIKGDTVLAIGRNAKATNNVAIKYFTLFNRDQVTNKAELPCPHCGLVLGNNPSKSLADNRTMICQTCSNVEVMTKSPEYANA